MLDSHIAAGSAGRGLLVAKSYYFLFFAAIGCLVPFFNIYLESKGLTGVEIGWLGSIPPMIALGANPFWGAVADSWKIHRLVLALCAFVAGLVSLFFLGVSNFWLLLTLVTALAFFRTPIGSIVDSTVMDMLKRANSGSSYGQQRLWGTVGFVLATFSLGQLLSPANLALIFWLHGGLLSLACAGLSFLLPIESAPHQVGMWQGLRRLTTQGGYLSFLIAMTLLGMGISAYIGFLGLHIMALGGNEAQVGLAWTANSLPEVILMYFGARWLGRYSHKRLIIAGFVGFTLVWILAALAPTPALLIAVLPGMGICFGFFWVAAVGYASEAAPPGLSATAQALMGAAQSGLGWSLGSVVAGYLWDQTNGHVVLFFAAAVFFLATLIFWWGNRHSERIDLAGKEEYNGFNNT
ncbi:MAG: MFS transporter [Anaerolineae bacterium]|nr:MFS transporter [Anaerolineae bacterium]